MVLTQQKDTTQYMATMEAASRTTENAIIYNIPAACVVKPAGYPSDPTTSPNDSVARVNGSGQKIGPAIILRVMAADVVSIGCKSYYTTQTETGTNSSFNDVLNSLAAGIQTVTGGAEGTTAQLTGSGAPLFNVLTSFMNANNPTVPSKPRAWLNWMHMDNQLKYDSSSPQSGAIPVSNYAAGSLGTPAQSSIQITKSGFLFIYVNNETQGWDVYFGNLSIQVNSGPVLEENHYYPYGLGMAALSSKALKPNYIENKNRFNNGTELQTHEFNDGSGLEMYDASARGYDQQIGRFRQVDPLADHFANTTGYSFTGGNPLLFIDPTGTTKVLYRAPTGIRQRIRRQRRRRWRWLLVWYRSGTTWGYVLFLCIGCPGKSEFTSCLPKRLGLSQWANWGRRSIECTRETIGSTVTLMGIDQMVNLRRLGTITGVIPIRHPSAIRP